MAVHIGAVDEKSSTKGDRQETAVLWQVDEITREVDQTTAKDVSSQGTKYVTGDIGQQCVMGHGVGSVRVKHDAHNTPPPSVGTASATIGGCKTFLP